MSISREEVRLRLLERVYSPAGGLHSELTSADAAIATAQKLEGYIFGDDPVKRMLGDESQDSTSSDLPPAGSSPSRHSTKSTGKTAGKTAS